VTAPAGELGRVIDRLWDVLGDRTSLFPVLPADAALARAGAGELKAAMPRLLELAVGGVVETMEITEPFDLLREAEWTTWPAAERQAVEKMADTWWEWTRRSIEPQPGVGVVLACLCRLGVPPIRWLGPWLEDLDGPAAQHLARIVIEQLPEAEWTTMEDQRQQILAWSRTEAVVIGLTVVGGVHLDDGQLSAALDLML
jgi:hypothetical protein